MHHKGYHVFVTSDLLCSSVCLKGYHVFVYIRSSMFFSVSQRLPRVCLHQIFYVFSVSQRLPRVCLKGYHVFVYIRSSVFFSVSQRLPRVCLHQIFCVLQCVSKVNTKVWMLWLLALRLSKTWFRCSQSFYVLLCVAAGSSQDSIKWDLGALIWTQYSCVSLFTALSLP